MERYKFFFLLFFFIIILILILFKEKASSLSTVIVIGPPTVHLLKPVTLIVDHCVENASEDWNISLFTSQNDENLETSWTVSVKKKKL